MSSDSLTPTEAANDAPTTPTEFAQQLLSQLYGDLDGVLSYDDNGEATDSAYATVLAASANGAPRGASLYVMAQAAVAAYRALMQGESSIELPEPDAVGEVVLGLCPQAESALGLLSRHAQRLARYAAEAEPAAPHSLPVSIAIAVVQLYQGMLEGNHSLGSRGLISLRTLLAHCDAMASLLDLAEGDDRPVRVFAPDRFHDHFLFLTQQVQQTPSSGADQPVAALTKDGRLTAVITADDHPLEAAAEAVRERIPGDPTTKEHGLLRMQGLLRMIEGARQDPRHPFVGSLRDERQHLALVTAAATCPMRSPGQFGFMQLNQIFRYNLRLLGGASAL